MMKRIHVGLVLSAMTLAACGEQPITGIEAASSAKTPSTVVSLAAPVTQTICSTASIDWPATPQNPNWAPAVAGSVWVGKTATSSTDAPRLGINSYSTSFSVPAGATGISIAGNVLADNDVVIAANATNFFDTGAGGYPPNAPDYSTTQNFQTVGGLPFSRNTGLNAGNNTVTFTLYNDDNPNEASAGFNPSGLSFCYTVTYTPAEVVRPVALFVIGDVEAHALGDNVNFWGSQWWKNNQMSGEVSNGVASFKGYATSSDNVCGGTWTSLPGNSSNPPATIPADVVIIVTSKVIKKGNNISGDIVQLVSVKHDGKYSDNPGHHGNGPVTSIICGANP